MSVEYGVLIEGASSVEGDAEAMCIPDRSEFIFCWRPYPRREYASALWLYWSPLSGMGRCYQTLLTLPDQHVSLHKLYIRAPNAALTQSL